MAVPQASSRLELLQARFQQKQLQEKEQKLLQLYDQQQQRAYQVVQRGSASSNGSSHGSTISQHTVTKTSTSSHATSTSQGGKVRQMFDERRQTTVKGIDRSYPLEPLENKPRKQTNGNAVQRNGNVTVSRQSVTVKRVARADANSNLNGGKPIVSYHEEITRESFGPSQRQHADDDEFGNENHVARYANGNHRDQTHIEEVLDEDTTQRNRMMAKLHLMEYDETLKHRVKNDLESEEFPEDFTVDVPDKLPKQSVTKKLSQAEVRLERFKNANAKRSNSVAKHTSTISVPKKRSDPVFPPKSTSSGNEMMKNRTQKIVEKGSLGRRESPRSGEPEVTSMAYKNVEDTLSSSDSEGGRRRRSDSPRFSCKESEKSATTYAIDSKNARRFSPDLSKDVRRSESPKFFCDESEKSATTYAIDSKRAGRLSPDFSRNIKKRNGSPKFFCKESGKSATTYAIDSKTARKFSPEFSKDMKHSLKMESKRSKNVSAVDNRNIVKKSDRSAVTMGIDTIDRYDTPSLESRRISRTPSPEVVKKIERKAESKPIKNKSPNFFERLRERSLSPQFFNRKSKKSAITVPNIKNTKSASKSPEPKAPHLKVSSEKQERSNVRSAGTKSPDSRKKVSRNTSTSPQLFSTDSDRSSTIILIKPETIIKPKTESAKSRRKQRTPEPSISKPDVTFTNRIKEINKKTSEENVNASSKYNIRNSVSRFFSEQCEKAAGNVDVGLAEPDRSSDLSRESSPVSLKAMNASSPTSSSSSHRKKSGKSAAMIDVSRSSRESSPKSRELVNRKEGTPEFFCYETNKSATTVSLKPKPTKQLTDERSKSSRSKTSNSINESSKNPDIFSSMKNTKITVNIGNSSNRDSSPRPQKIVDSRSGTPEFFCYETDRSATTVSLKPKPTKDSITEGSKNLRAKSGGTKNVQTRSSKSPDNFSSTKSSKVTVNISKSSSRDTSPRSQKIVDSRSGTPEFFCYETDRSATTVSLKPTTTKDSTMERSKSPRPKSNSSTSIPFLERSTSPDNFTHGGRTSSRDSPPKSQKIADSRSGTPEFFCYEAERSATTVSLKSESSKDSINEHSKSPRPRSNTPTAEPRNRSLKSPDSLTVSKDVKITTRRGSGNVLHSTKLIRDIIRHQSRKTETDSMSRRDPKELRRTSTVSENAEGMSSVKGTELKHRSRKDELKELKVNKDASKSTTSPPRLYELPSPKLSPKSSTSLEVDAEIQKITMPNRYINQQKLEREHRSTYSKSCEASQGFRKKSKTESSFTYSVRKAGKKRSSLFESSIFEASRKDRRKTDDRGTRKTIKNASVTREGVEKDISLKRMIRNASSAERLCSSSSSPTNESSFRDTRHEVRENIMNGVKERKILRSLKRTGSPSQPKDAGTRVSLNETVLGESKHHRLKKQTQTLRSIDLVRKMMKRESQETQKKVFHGTEVSREVVPEHGTPSRIDDKTEIKKSSSTRIEMINLANESGSSSKDYERTDSVESALRRFDSIDTETGTASAQSTLERSKGSITEKRQTRLESNGIGSSTDGSKTISLKALDGGNVNSPRNPANEPSRATLKKTSAASEPELAEASCGTEALKTQEPRRQKKLAKARDSIELARTAARSKSPACRRKLFQDAEAGSSRSKCSLDSMKTAERLSSRKIESTKSAASEAVETASNFLKSASGETSTKDTGKGETDETSTGAANADCSLSVKQLRSIEDIRKSIEGESPSRRAKGVSLKSAIASNALRGSSTIQPQWRRMRSEEGGGNRNEMLAKRSENLSARNNALKDSEGFVKCESRFSRVAKSPSPDSTKTMETGNRQRRNVPPSPSKSPDTMSRRSSTDSKVQDTKPSRRSMPMRSTESIGNRKTATTRRKSTDVVDGAILENGLHLRGQAAETKHDNDSPTSKKSEAFVIDFDEQPSKENAGPSPRKPVLRKQSTEKQTPSTQSGRPPSSVSSTSNGSSMQASVTKGKLASKTRMPVSGTATAKGSASSKVGGSACTIDGLLVPCKICGRRFAQDRVGMHEQICAKTGQKKRKQFDAMMHRVRGTELESFVRKGIGTCKKLNEKQKKPEVKSNWRRKHEDFINAIRSAKQVQAHLASGGRLSDLPPPPVSDTSDYIQCPHCGRKFNRSAAERHIPKCEHMLHNKPTPARVPPKPRR